MQTSRIAVGTCVRTLPAIPVQTWLGVATVAAMATYCGALSGFGFDVRAVATVAAVTAAALLSGIAGFAFSAICGAIVFQFRHDTVTVVQIMLVCSIANQALGVWALRHDIRLRALLPFLLGGPPGVVVGVLALLRLDARSYTTELGAMLLAYGCYMLVRKPIVLRHSPPVGDVLAGFVGGMFGGFAATPGAALSIWCGMKGWDKTAHRAVFQPVILVMQLLALGLIAALHSGGAVGSGGVPVLALACVPAGLVGTMWGLSIFHGMSDRHFRIAINLLLIVSGAGLAV